MFNTLFKKKLFLNKRFQKSLSAKKHLKPTIILSFILLLIACSESLPLKNDSELSQGNTNGIDRIKKSKNDTRKYKIIRLENELELVLVSDIELERSAVSLAVSAGSYNETNGFWGQAHFLEHMLFLGTEKYPEEGGFNTFISRNGGTNNAYTDMDHTNYMASIKNSAYEELLDRFSDYFKAPLLSAKYIEKERHAVHSEWSMKGVYDGVILGQLNGLTLNPQHPVANFTWGNTSSLKDQNGQTLHQTTVDFFQEHYQANRMKVALVSNLPISELENIAQKHFGTIRNSKTSKKQITASAITVNQKKKIIRYKPKKALKKIQLKFVIADNSSQFLSKPNYYVSYLLNSEMPNTLTSVLKNKGLAENLYAWADPTAFANAGEFVIDIDLTDFGLTKRDTVINTVFNYLALIGQKGISKQYYQEIKQSLQNSFDYQAKYSEYNYAANLAAKMHEVPNRYLLSSQYEFSQFNRGNIQALLKQLRIDNVRVFFIDKNQTVQKKMQFFDASYSIEDISVKQVEKWQQKNTEIQLALPELNSLLPSNFTLVKKQLQQLPLRTTTQQGSIIHFKNSESFDVPKGSITVNLNTNIGTRNAKDQALLLVLNKAISEEVSQLATQAYGAGMSLSLTNQQGLTLVTTGFSDKQFELQLSTFNRMNKMQVTKQYFDRYKGIIKDSLVNKSSNALYTQAFDYYRTFLNTGDYSTKSLLSALNNLTMTDYENFSKEFFNEIKINTFVYGNFDHSQSVSFVNSIEKALNTKVNNSPLFYKQYYQFSDNEQINIEVNAQQNDVAIIDAKWQEHTITKEATGLLLAKIVSPALFKQIRTEEQLGYSVGFYSDVRGKQITYAWYIQTPVKSPIDMLARFDAFKEKFNTEISTLTKENIKQYRQALLVYLTQKTKNIFEEQQDYINDWNIGNLHFDSKQKLVEAIKHVSVDEVQQLYSQINDPNQLSRVLVQIKGNNFASSPFIKLKYSQ